MDFFTYKIVDERGSGGGTDAAPQQKGGINKYDPASPKNSGLANDLASLFTLQKIGSAATTFVTSHIEAFTGSTIIQNKVNAGAQLLGSAIAIIHNPVAGIMALAMEMANRAIDLSLQGAKESARIAEASRRAGSSFNQSRL